MMEWLREAAVDSSNSFDGVLCVPSIPMRETGLFGDGTELLPLAFGTGVAATFNAVLSSGENAFVELSILTGPESIRRRLLVEAVKAVLDAPPSTTDKCAKCSRNNFELPGGVLRCKEGDKRNAGGLR